MTFGDSIIDGHLYKKAGFMEFVAEQEGMSVKNMPIMELVYCREIQLMKPGLAGWF